MSPKNICWLFVIGLAVGCSAKSGSDSSSSSSSDSGGSSAYRALYVSSGLCMAGNNTTFTTATSSNLLYRINLSNGASEVIRDYNGAQASAGDSPTAIADYDSNYLLALVESATGGRRVEKVQKKYEGLVSNYKTDSTNLNGVLLMMAFGTSANGTAGNGNIYISKTNSIEMYNSSLTRMGNPFIGTAPGGSCGATNAKYAGLALTNFGHVAFINSVAANNRVGIVKNSGGNNCLAGTNAPNANAFPSFITFVSTSATTGQLIVAYSGNATTTDLNSIYVYDVTETATTATLSAGTKIYDAVNYPGTVGYLLYATSAMVYDSVDGTMYIAHGRDSSTTVANYQIDKFTYVPATKTLTRVGTIPFYNYGLDTKCISDLFVGY